MSGKSVLSVLSVLKYIMLLFLNQQYSRWP